MSRWRSEKAFGSWLGLAPEPEEVGTETQVGGDAGGGEPGGEGLAAGGAQSAAVAECLGSVLPADRGPAWGAQGDHGDGLQAGADHLRAAQARGSVRGAGAGGVRGGVPAIGKCGS